MVYVANLIGAAGFAAFAVLIGPASASSTGPFSATSLCRDRPPGWVIFLSGVLAGWLMGLLSWLVAAAADTISQIVLVWLIATVIGLGAFAPRCRGKR